MLLTREVNISDISDSTVGLDLFSVSCHDYYKDDKKVEVRVEHNTNVALFVGENVSVINTIDRNDEISGTYQIKISENYEIVQNENMTKTFSLIADKYQNLTLNGVNIEVENNVLYLHFTFDEWHYFRSWETHGIDFMIDFMEKTIFFNNCEYVSDTELRWRYDANLTDLADFMCNVFRNDVYKFVGFVDAIPGTYEDYVEVQTIPENACFNDEMYLRRFVTPLNCKKYELYEKECNDGTIFGLQAYRLNFRFKNVNYVEIFVEVPIASVSFPLSLETGNDTYQEQNLLENFVYKETMGSKNRIVEMEKLVYHPVFKLDNVQENGCLYKDVSKIKFNFHFREREDDGWIVKTNGMWNGIVLDNTSGNYVLQGDVNVLTPNTPKFFSYVGNTDKGRQSDLLEYLGFNDTDVKYQKSSLKKSFIRLSFYDSPNRANQNLLCYSTVFVNSGLLFTKMMRGANRKKRYILSGDDSNIKYDNAKVNTEPCFSNYTGITYDDIEDLRLSSQIVVSDMFSDNCSEGFYLYLWADDDNGAIPSDIYMRVDFNHAGYGRIIPMTMPYAYNTDSKHIYTMQDICDIWTNGGWGVRINEKYSYIHFKYVYDSVRRRHVYFLDPDTYGYDLARGEGSDVLELNLFEPKIIN
jgi:hypothetical protein